MSDQQTSQSKKAEAFRQLHADKTGFIIANPWDAGTARLLQQLGFKALATTSSGFSWSRGHPDQSMSREKLLLHLSDLVQSVDVPISADLEGGFGDSPEAVQQTILAAANTGVVGGSIEDATGQEADPLYAMELAADRIRAAADAARSLPFPFTLTARAGNYVVGQPDLADTIRRLQAYQEAGADVLYAPGLTKQRDIATVLGEVDRPVNVLIGVAGMELDPRQLLEMGVRRVSVGGSLARAALGAFLRAAGELYDQGTAQYALSAANGHDLDQRFSL